MRVSCRTRKAWAAASVWIFIVTAPFCARCAAQAPPGDLPADVSVGDIVEGALKNGDRVLLKRVEYEEGATPFPARAGERAERVRSRTYIEISRRPTPSGEAGLVESQERVARSQREMARAVRELGKGQRRLGGGIAETEGLERDLAAGMKSSRSERSALRGEAARTGASVGDVDRTVQESESLLRSIDAETRALSGAVTDLASRVGDLRESISDAAEEAARADKEKGEEGEEMKEEGKGGGGGRGETDDSRETEEDGR